MTATYKEYIDTKQAFFAKHNHDFTTHTSSMDQYSRYSKIYTFTDGAQWIEEMSPVTETTEVTVRGCKCKVTVELQRIEFYNSDNAASEFYYEQY